MKIIQLPPGVHTAFNPVIIRIQKEAGEPDEFTLAVSIAKDTYSFNATQERDFLNNNLLFDISEVLKKSFVDYIQEQPDANIYVDGKLVTEYRLYRSVVNPGPIGSVFYAVNAVVQIGESSNLQLQLGTFRTRFKRLTRYEGYPLDVSVLGYQGGTYYNFEGQSPSEQINLPHFTVRVNGNHDYLTISSVVGWDPLQDQDGITITDEQGNIIYVASSDGTHELRRIYIDNKCTPEKPFYVKWINQQGGWDYWMFSFRQYKTRNTQNEETFVPTVFDQETATAFLREFYKEGIEEITVGADGLTANQYEVISKLIYSPDIQAYDTLNQKWYNLIVDGGENQDDTRSSSKSVTFTFMLPQPQIQY